MKYLKKFEGILEPYRLEEREELLKLGVERKLSSEVIEGNLVIDHPFYLEVESRVKKVEGDVIIELDKIPLWLSDVEVGGDFSCWMNNLTSLRGAPRAVGGSFYCSGNNLTKLEGVPQSVGGDFDCSWNNITSLVGAPSLVGGSFHCYNNSVEFTEGDVREVSNVRGNIYI